MAVGANKIAEGYETMDVLVYNHTLYKITH